MKNERFAGHFIAKRINKCEKNQNFPEVAESG
jgi:hypothetical protein